MKTALIGDSIRMGYAPFVTELLPDVDFFQPEANGGDSRNLLAHFDEWFVVPKADLIHVNCGLHDLRYLREKERHQVELDEYRENLAMLVDRVLALEGSRLAWATITPVIDEYTCAPDRDFWRHNSDVDAYNAAALEVMLEKDVPVDDLYAAIEKTGRRTIIGPDGCHMPESGRKAVAEVVAAFLKDFMDLKG